MMDNELYQEVLLQYARRPVNFGPLEKATHQAEGHNAMCGDEIAVALKIEDGKVADVKFSGSSCAICTASACLMTGEIKGLTCDAACILAVSFRELIREGNSPGVTEKLRILDRVHQFPQRVKCAALPWETMVSALKSPLYR